MDHSFGLRAALDPFFDLNPNCVYKDTEEGGIVADPWLDDTVEIHVNKNNQALIQSLNHVYMPPRLSAIWHKDSRDLEFIWTVAPSASPVTSRAFEFHFQTRTYFCEFADASSRLSDIADAARLPKPPSPTYHRNLMLVSRDRLRSILEIDPTAKIVSFWLRDINWNDTIVLELAQHLNFYMTYYDRMSPFILIHSPAALDRPTTPDFPTLHPFPSSIVGRVLDPNLLMLWEAAKTREPFLKFIYLYQIIEYAAFYRLSDEAEARVRRLLTSPDVLARINDTTRGLVDAVADLRSTDDHRMDLVIKLVIDPDTLWPVFEANKAYFASPIDFDGGLHLDRLIEANWGLEDFRTGAFSKLPNCYRQIRNGLAHAREKRMSGVIHPTLRNADRLQPWLEPLRIIAAHTILYEST